MAGTTRMIFGLAPLFAALLFSGCITMGHPFPISQVRSIQVGKTTRKDLEARFGEAYRNGVDDGDATATWVDYYFSILGTQETRDLYVRFAADGTVKKYSFNSNVPEDQTSLQGGK